MSPGSFSVLHAPHAAKPDCEKRAADVCAVFIFFLHVCRGQEHLLVSFREHKLQWQEVTLHRHVCVCVIYSAGSQ